MKLFASMIVLLALLENLKAQPEKNHIETFFFENVNFNGINSFFIML